MFPAHIQVPNSYKAAEPSAVASHLEALFSQGLALPLIDDDCLGEALIYFSSSTGVRYPILNSTSITCSSVAFT